MDLGFIAPKETKIRLALEPAYNALCSLTLLSEDIGGVDDWVDDMVARLSPDEVKTNGLRVELVFLQLGSETWPSFPALIDDLAGDDPEAVHARIAARFAQMLAKQLGDDVEIPDPDDLFANRERFLALCQQLLRVKGEGEDHGEWCFNIVDLMQQPPDVLQRDLVDHLRMMWDTYLADEWERNLPLLRESLAAFESLDLSNLTTSEAIRRIIGRDEPEQWGNWRDGLDEIIFIPSPHIGPYVLLIEQSETTARVVFGARIPEGATVRSPALSRSDLTQRLEALADDTRLRILESVALEGEQGQKDIMDRFDLSKSAVSRHLRQLTANGYLIVRQQDVSKYYRLNPSRIDETLRMLKSFLQLPGG
jgi:DNA-binding transcriptional ArsR family regulator